MAKINIEVSERLLEAITEEDARAVKRRLEAAHLSQTWLLYHLEEIYGIKISTSNISDLLNGRWSISRNKHDHGRKIIFCAKEILGRYESVF